MPGLVASRQQPCRSSAAAATAASPRRRHRTDAVTCRVSRIDRSSDCAEIFTLSCDVCVKCAGPLSPARCFMAELVTIICRYPRGMYWTPVNFQRSLLAPASTLQMDL